MGHLRTTIADYASAEINEIWSPKRRVVLERELWVEIMRLQAKAGLDIPQEAIDDYEAMSPDADLDQIEAIERRTKHDLRARLEHFNAQAGHKYAHWGLTSCDITDNATQIQIRESIRVIRKRIRQVLELLAQHIQASRHIVIVARTHNQPAQATLVGKRFATIADELICADGNLMLAAGAQPLRGLVGAVGTAEDLLNLVGPEGVEQINQGLRERLGFNCYYGSTGQVYPRSDDRPWISAIAQATAGPTNLARMIRLEAGQGRMWESFEDGQVGSSAMPHKRNPIVSERVCGLQSVVRGFEQMLLATSGEQWYEGDVSDSATRRIALPGLFQAVDAVLINTTSLLCGLDLSRQRYEMDLTDNWDRVKTGEALSAAIAAGVDRDEAYRILQEWSDAQERTSWPELPSLSRETVAAIWRQDPNLEVAQGQIQRVLDLIEEVVNSGNH